LSTYDPEVALRVRTEERLEEERIEFAKGLLLEGDSIEKIVRLTKLPCETISEFQNGLAVA
jgi:predicted transposase YdaD